MPESLEKVREFCSFGCDQKHVDLAKECDVKEKGIVNFYFGAPLELFVCYDRTACWTHPQSGNSIGATDATAAATHMTLEAASLDPGSVWISCFDEIKAKEVLRIPENWQPLSMLYFGCPAEDFAPNMQPGGYRKPLSETVFITGCRNRFPDKIRRKGTYHESEGTSGLPG